MASSGVGGVIAHTTRSERVLENPNEPPLLEGHTYGSGEGRMEHTFELMKTVPHIPHDLPLSGAKTAQDRVITILKLRVKRLEKKSKARTLQPLKRRLFKGRVETFIEKTLGEDASKQGRNDDSSGEKGGSTADQTLVKIRSEKAKEKEKGVVLIDEEEPPRLNRSTTTLQPLPTIDPKDKELAQRLHEEEFAELDKAQKERQKQEEATKQEKYTIEERARLLAKFFKRRKKQLAAERAEAIRNKPPTRTQKLYEREKKWIDDFKPIDDDSQQQAESTKKRSRADSKEESSKKQKLEEDNDVEKEELRDSMDVVPRDDVAIDVESLATKYPIVVWKTHILNENMMYYQIIRADGSSKNYKIFSEMLDDFDR
ncbi:hypothetical protein Tco_1263313 [Tanacetum coccineum]